MVTIRGHFSLSQHRLARRSSAVEAARVKRGRWLDENRSEVTEILPLDGFDFGDLDDLHDFGELDELDFSNDSTFDNEAQVLLAPELDDLDDIDNLAPLWLAEAITEVLPRVTVRPDAERHRDHLRVTDVIAVVRGGGQHRKEPTSAAKGRLLISAMAAGAAAAAAHTATTHTEAPKSETVLTASASTLTGAAGGNATRGAQVITVQPAALVAVHNEELAKGLAFANDRAQREARLQQPLFVMPTKGIFTSNFGYRWGVLHAGIDLANSVGTPIYAVSDGVVIDSGPTAGYGMWVKLRHADGTVTLYGHINTTLVSVGDRVMAGDQIATMGNRGNSTGPHLHFEVLQGGTDRIDPVPWLATRGLYVGNYSG
jgi:murein DD-endopeptidase MepM/ murein hydrolase activator NlpD